MTDNNDHLEISNLLNIYFRYLDEARFDEVGLLFANAEFLGPASDTPIVNDAAAVAANYANHIQLYDPSGRAAKKGTGGTLHAGQNLVLTINGDTAESWMSAIVFQAVENFPLQPIAVAKYDDRFERVQGKWRFAARKLTIGITGDMSRHVFEVSAMKTEGSEPSILL